MDQKLFVMYSTFALSFVISPHGSVLAVMLKSATMYSLDKHFGFKDGDREKVVSDKLLY